MLIRFNNSQENGRDAEGQLAENDPGQSAWTAAGPPAGPAAAERTLAGRIAASSTGSDPARWRSALWRRVEWLVFRWEDAKNVREAGQSHRWRLEMLGRAVGLLGADEHRILETHFPMEDARKEEKLEKKGQTPVLG
ncbi:hypothetical protein VTN00DRAFT_2592 [Thermoascus crustaceus]|uniref:uncharacterized protein n=1 Tax=Thermoascus crustaceus TaxID=5088 RepID=UPI0037447C55